MPDTLHLRLLGGLTTTFGTSSSPLRFPSTRAELFLAYLALNPSPHSREELADFLWDGRPRKQVLSNLPEQKFSEVKTQKALLHSWLAWQKTPGMPFGQAIQAGYFDLNTTSVSDFAKWFSATFKLEQ